MFPLLRDLPSGLKALEQENAKWSSEYTAKPENRWQNARLTGTLFLSRFPKFILNCCTLTYRHSLSLKKHHLKRQGIYSQINKKYQKNREQSCFVTLLCSSEHRMLWGLKVLIYSYIRTNQFSTCKQNYVASIYTPCSLFDVLNLILVICFFYDWSRLEVTATTLTRNQSFASMCFLVACTVQRSLLSPNTVAYGTKTTKVNLCFM